MFLEDRALSKQISPSSFSYLMVILSPTRLWLVRSYAYNKLNKGSFGKKARRHLQTREAKKIMKGIQYLSSDPGVLETLCSSGSVLWQYLQHCLQERAELDRLLFWPLVFI